MKNTILLITLWYVSSFAFSQSFHPLDWEEPLCEINEGIKQITEKADSKWTTISVFNTAGFLIDKDTYYKKEERAKYRYEYVLIDDILRIHTKNTLRAEDEEYTSDFYYNKANFHYLKFENRSANQTKDKPIVDGRDFVYQGSQLTSYIRNADTLKYTYNTTGQLIKREVISPVNARVTEYIYDKMNRLTDMITTSNEYSKDQPQGGYMGVVTYSQTEQNKYHIRFAGFDKNGNWTKSYFVTGDGTKYRSGRKIVYQ